MLRGFIALRVIVITTLLLSALLIQLTFDINLPLEPIYYLAAFAYGTSILAIFTLRKLPGEAHAGMQIVGDLAVITGIVFLSRGPDSGFTFLYVGSISAGAVLLGRRGGLITAALASVFYSVLVYLMHVNALPTYEAIDIPVRVLSRGMVVTNIALNIAAFFATGLLVSVASQKLRETQTDLERRKNEMARLSRSTRPCSRRCPPGSRRPISGRRRTRTRRPSRCSGCLAGILGRHVTTARPGPRIWQL
jgi:two-component system sensor histidine kinase PilS (NtrC family)